CARPCPSAGSPSTPRSRRGRRDARMPSRRCRGTARRCQARSRSSPWSSLTGRRSRGEYPGDAAYTARSHPPPTKAKRLMFVFKAAVVGAGTMGGEIAHAIANSDIPVVLKDVDQKFVDQGIQKARSIWQGQV